MRDVGSITGLPTCTHNAASVEKCQELPRDSVHLLEVESGVLGTQPVRLQLSKSVGIISKNHIARLPESTKSFG
jgi:hypothetical protein